MELTHINQNGEAHMVDIGAKPITERTATALAEVFMQPQTLQTILRGNMKKGDVFGAARIAAIMAAKRTHELIPLCHPIPISGVEVQIEPGGADKVEIRCTVRCAYGTGVEMEALCAASVGALTIYDMCKAVDRAMTISAVRLLHKAGGKSGEFDRLRGGEVLQVKLEGGEGICFWCAVGGGLAGNWRWAARKTRCCPSWRRRC